jgi:hypothetical protein
MATYVFDRKSGKVVDKDTGVPSSNTSHVHSFICNSCGHVESTIDTGGKDCPLCGNKMAWDLGGATIIGDGTYNKKVVSESLAINVSQIAEHKRLFPNVELTVKDGCACPTFHDYKTHDEYLRKTGFVKHPQKLHNTRKIYT